MTTSVFAKINEKIQKVEEHIKEYNSLKEKMYETLDEKNKKEIFSPEYFDLNDKYLECCVRMDVQFNAIKRGVRSLAKDLGFTVKMSKDDVKYEFAWESAFTDIKFKFRSVMDMMYNSRYSFSRYFEPAV